MNCDHIICRALGVESCLVESDAAPQFYVVNTRIQTAPVLGPFGTAAEAHAEVGKRWDAGWIVVLRVTES